MVTFRFTHFLYQIVTKDTQYTFLVALFIQMLYTEIKEGGGHAQNHTGLPPGNHTFCRRLYTEGRHNQYMIQVNAC